MPDDTSFALSPSVDDAIAAIRAYVRSKDWSLYRVAKESGLPGASVRDIFKPEWAPNTPTLRALYQLIPADFDPASVAPLDLDGESDWHDQRKLRKRRGT